MELPMLLKHSEEECRQAVNILKGRIPENEIDPAENTYWCIVSLLSAAYTNVPILEECGKKKFCLDKILSYNALLLEPSCNSGAHWDFASNKKGEEYPDAT